MRFCWPCSVKEGRLVSRVAPALERKRRRKQDVKDAAKLRKLNAEAAKALEPTLEPGTLDGKAWILAEYERLRMLPVFKSSKGSSTYPKKSARCNKLSARIWRKSHKATDRAGHQHPYENRITISVGPKCSRATVSELLLHELCHAATASVRGASDKHGNRKWVYHGCGFKRTLCRAAKQAYDLDVKPSDTKTAYGLDRVIIRALKDAQPAMQRKLCEETPNVC